MCNEKQPCPTPEEMWNTFIEHLNVVQPLGKGKETARHQSFIGSIAGYRKVFLEANKRGVPPS